MPYDIIVRFPNKEVAEEFTGQMSDGFGEGFCEFTVWEETVDKETGKAKYSRVIDATTGLPVCFVNEVFEV